MSDLCTWARRQRPRVRRLTAGVQVRDADRRRREFDNATNLGSLFIENVKYKPTLHARVQPYDLGGHKRVTQRVDVERTIDLRAAVESAPLQTTLQEALYARISQRTYSGGDLTIEQLSSLFQLGAGVIPQAQSATMRRTYPSGGGIYPCEVFCIARRVKEVPKGIYRFDPEAHCIHSHADFLERTERELDRYFSPAAALVVLLVVDIETMLLRYEELAYKLSLLEAGHVAQNFVLVGAALALRGTTLCYFPDDTINAMLRIDGRRKFVCYAIEFGR